MENVRTILTIESMLYEDIRGPWEVARCDTSHNIFGVRSDLGNGEGRDDRDSALEDGMK